MEHILSNYSFSSNQTFRECPRRWWVEKVLKQKLPSSEAASFGNQYDSLITQKLGLEPSDKKGFEGEKPISEQILLDGVEDAVDQYLLQPFACKKGETSCAQKKIEFDPDMWALIAESLGLCLEIDLPFIGYLDHEKQEGLRRTVVDQKTSKRKGMRATWAEQVIIYGIRENASAGEVHLMTRTKTPAFYNYPVMINDDSKKWAMINATFIANQIAAALKEGSGENLPRNPDYWCSWCAESLECPAKGAYVG